jgi:hypothetical protein
MQMPKTQFTGYWTFFCNPAVWAIDEFLSSHLQKGFYFITDWQEDWFKPGQLGVIRVGTDRRTKRQLKNKGRLQPGVYAIVEVLGTPRHLGTAKGPFWVADMTGAENRLVVDIQYIHNMLENPLLLKQLKVDPNINDDYLIEGFQASSMPLDPSTFRRIVSLTEREDYILENIKPEPVATQSEIRALEHEYSDASPEVREIISKRIERGPVANKVKELMGYKCMICDQLGRAPISFYKKDGQPYIEAHHVIPLYKLDKGSLGPSNLITVCANHHRQLHYGDTKLLESGPDKFVFQIDGEIIKLKKLTADLLS